MRFPYFSGGFWGGRERDGVEKGGGGVVWCGVVLVCGFGGGGRKKKKECKGGKR